MVTKRPGTIESRAETAQLLPELLRDLEVVALVPAHIQERLIAREGKIICGGAGANRLAALAVEVGPVRTEHNGFRRSERSALETAVIPPSGLDNVISRSPAVSHDKPSITAVASPSRSTSFPGRPTTGRLADRAKRDFTFSAGFPHRSSVLRHRRKRSPVCRSVGRTACALARGPGTMAIVGSSGSRAKVIAGDGVGQNSELECRIGEGLHPHSGRAEARVAQADDDRFAFGHAALHDFDMHGAVPGARRFACSRSGNSEWRHWRLRR